MLALTLSHRKDALTPGDGGEVMDLGVSHEYKHHWCFFRVGGVDQVDLRTGADVIHLDQLDQKLWVALACPVDNVEFDRRTLELLDTDHDGRIRAPEILEATRWVRQVFKKPDDIILGGDAVALEAINEGTEAGRVLQATAKRVLSTLGKANATELTLADVSDTAKIFAATDFNGDGIIPASSAIDDGTRKVIEEIIATQGSVLDRSGKPGINLEKLSTFLAETAELLGWQNTGEDDPAILPAGSATFDAAAAIHAVQAKVDDFFLRCRLAEFDERYRTLLNGAEAEITPAAGKQLALQSEEIVKLPLARVEAGRALPLVSGLNPAWSAAVAVLREKAVTPLLAADKEELSESEWERIKTVVAPFQKWNASKPVTAVEKLGIPRLREIAAAGMGEKISALIQRDAAFGVAADQITALEKLVRVKRDLFRLLNNFVSFSDFYARRGAIFQAGTLYLDSRSCDLCVHVDDAGKHAVLAGLAKAYLAYCDCTRPGAKRTIAAAFTAGDSDHLMVGRNGVFYDRAGRDWDATITRIVDNPISIRQAFLSPYKKFIRMIEEQIARRAASGDAALEASLTGAAAKIGALKPVDPNNPAIKKIDVGTVAALGVALGSLGTFLALVFTKFVDLGWWAPLAAAGVILAISGPSMVIAFLKLRQRNLGPILDANGWAVNGRTKINVPFGGALSKTAKLPPGAERQLIDPFQETHIGRDLAIAAVVLAIVLPICWRLHWLDRVLPTDLQPSRPPVILPLINTNGAPTR